MILQDITYFFCTDSTSTLYKTAGLPLLSYDNASTWET